MTAPFHLSNRCISYYRYRLQ